MGENGRPLLLHFGDPPQQFVPVDLVKNFCVKFVTSVLVRLPPRLPVPIILALPPGAVGNHSYRGNVFVDEAA